MEKIKDFSKKQGRVLLLVFSSIITGFLFIAPSFLEKEAAERTTALIPVWLPLYTMIVIFYFKSAKQEPDK